MGAFGRRPAARPQDAEDLAEAGYPVGELNDSYIKSRGSAVVQDGGQVCVAWGDVGTSCARVGRVLDLLGRPASRRAR